MRVIAFDIGMRNLAWTVVDYSSKTFSEHSQQQQQQQHQQPPRTIHSDIQKTIVSGMNVLDLQVFDACDGGVTNMMEVYRNIHSYLESWEMVWDKADVILVEQQMSTGKIHNIKAIKISQHILAYFLIRFPQKKLVEYGATFKTSLFGVHFKIKADRKKWSVEKVKELLEEDPVALDILELIPKKDDVCDCVLMTFVYCFQSSR